jgi:hypothetical protein
VTVRKERSNQLNYVASLCPTSIEKTDNKFSDTRVFSGFPQVQLIRDFGTPFADLPSKSDPQQA